MHDDDQDEAITHAINNITQRLSETLLQEFMKLPENLQLNLVLIKSTQLLLANILCQIASNKNELIKVTDEQGREIKELTMNCVHTGFANKFESKRH